MNTWCLILLAVPAAAAEDHERANPVYRDLRQTGVAVTATEKAKLPALGYQSRDIRGTKITRRPIRTANRL